MANYYIGTSAWSQKEWGKKFFPPDVPEKDHLSYLAQHFNTVELNASFYRMQPESNFVKWHSETPADFQFAIKTSRYITHIKRLKDTNKAWKMLYDNSKPLKKKRGPFLVQFPSFYKGTPDQIKRTEAFLKYARKLDKKVRLTFEFRSKECFSDEMLAVLENYKAALVFADSSKYPHAPLDFAPADFVYFRLHGPRKLFGSSYKDEELRVWAKPMKKFNKSGKDVYAYFNNDMHAYAPENAKLLQQLVGYKR